MKITEATALIRTPLIEWARPQSWCDLGSGSGAATGVEGISDSGDAIHGNSGGGRAGFLDRKSVV